MELEFSRQIFEKKNFQVPNFMKIHPVGAELFRASGHSDMTKPVLAFRNFSNVPNNGGVSPYVFISALDG
jgi:hypothetical protein